MAEAMPAIIAAFYLDVTTRRALRRERVFRDRRRAFELHDAAFRELFRLPKCLVIRLNEDIREFIPSARRRSSITVDTMVLATLRFLATGSYQRAVGQEITICLSQKSVSNCIRIVSSAISRHLLARWVRFPKNNDELTTVKRRFMAKYNFPGVMGAIDCTHIAIIAPATTPDHAEHAFVNRKGFHSLNVQIVSDSNMNIINVNARFPGSSHDSFIWSMSSPRQNIVLATQNGSLIDTWLIGDSGYPFEPWLLTPIANATSVGECRYNTALSKLRNVVESTFGLMKQVWRCLLRHRVLHYDPTTASNIIVTCCILHNMFVANNLPLPEIYQHEEAELEQDCHQDAPTPRRGNPLAVRGQELQARLIRCHFSRI